MLHPPTFPFRRAITSLYGTQRLTKEAGPAVTSKYACNAVVSGRSLNYIYLDSRPLRGRTTLRRTSSASSSISPDEDHNSPVRSPHSSPPRSPSHWSPSVRGSPEDSHQGLSDAEEELEDVVQDVDTDSDDAADEHAAHNTSSTKLGTQSPKSPKVTANYNSPPLSMPPPLAQRRTRLPPSSVPYATSSPLPFIHSQPQPSATAERISSLPPSSLPAPASSLRTPPSPTSSPHPHNPTSVPTWGTSRMRRVPPPQVGTLSRDPDASGEGRVLVENSDSASPRSQRIALSQSQSQSQSQHRGSQEQGQSSQSQHSSKLRNEVELAETQAEENPRADERPEVSTASEGLAAPELEQGSQESAKSRQSLSYKGDSQSQDKPAVAEPLPDAQAEMTVETDEHMVVDAVGEISHFGATDAEDSAPQPEQPRASPRASPMPVDELPVATPGWAAIRATTSPEDEGNSEDDVDELLSDPLAFEQKISTPPRQNRGRKAKDRAVTKGKERLDSDDERTAAMVDRYTQQTTQAVNKPRQSSARESSPAKHLRQSAPVVEDQPPVRTQGRWTKRGGDILGPGLPPEADVFISEGSLRKEPPNPSVVLKSRTPVPAATARVAEREEVASVQRSNRVRSEAPAHDPSVWHVPTFMRKDAAVPEKAVGSRKRAARASLSTEAEGPAAKKRKTSAGAALVTGTTGAVAEHSGSARNLSTSMPGGSKAPVPSRKVPLGASSTVHRAVMTAQDSTSKSVKYVDLRAVSRSNSRSSSRASRAGSRGSHSEQVTHARGTAASASSKGKDRVRSVKREDADTPLPSQARAALSGSKSRNATRLSTSVPSHDLSQPGTTMPKFGLHDSRDSQPDATRQLLQEYRTSFQPTRTPGGPPLLAWDDLLEILLETGRARTEAMRPVPAQGAGSSA